MSEQYPYYDYTNEEDADLLTRRKVRRGTLLGLVIGLALGLVIGFLINQNLPLFETGVEGGVWITVVINFLVVLAIMAAVIGKRWSTSGMPVRGNANSSSRVAIVGLVLGLTLFLTFGFLVFFILR
ncbi:MAG: hypothetical protein JXB35_07915 [Anaerolineae bacterium]|nr:hypothetical protein [Anaerolineae bacterium]